MGCLWASALHQAGYPVSLVLRNPAQLQQYPGYVRVDSVQPLTASGGTSRSAGAQTALAESQQRQSHIPAWEPQDGPPARLRPVRWLMIATKIQDTAAALASVSPWLDGDATIVLLQNGLRVQRELSSRYGDRILCLSSSQGAWQRAPWHVVSAGPGQAWLGQLNPQTGSKRLQEALRNLLTTETCLSADVDINARLWRKFAVNCAINALTVKYDCHNGELLDNADRQRHVQALCKEIETVLRAIGNSEPGMPNISQMLQPGLYSHVEAVLRATAINVSSTLQDVRRGRPTELAELNGYLLQLANAAGLSAPCNQELMAELEHYARIPGHL